MFAKFALLALVGCVAANPAILLAEDDGQWRPELDGSAWGSGLIQWGVEDGSWKPHLDGSVLGDGHLTWLSRKRRSVGLVNPNALNVPLDEPITAWAKNAQLIQQQTEGTRNILGGGIPLALPADTPEVAAGKQAHAIAHANQVAATAGHGLIATPAVAAVSPVVATHAVATPWAATHAVAAPWAASHAVAAVSPVVATRAVATPWAATHAVAAPWAATHAVAAPWAARTIATPWAAAPWTASHVGLAGPLGLTRTAWW